MKFAISGTHSTGKTILAHKLMLKIKEKYPNKKVGILNEVAREYFPVRTGDWLAKQIYIFAEQLKQETIASQKYDITVCDRTMLDNVFYLEYFISNEPTFCELSEKFYPDKLKALKINLELTALTWLDTYDKIFFTLPDEAMVSDGVRIEDDKLRVFVSEKLRKTYKGFHNAFYVKNILDINIDEIF